mmetsp:Transcript_30733/g.72214  ORF Transcript_30733/g.72214 Transcript_30733/m.72214 type:complete len:204 (+) Transcript_30733:335-946(+)
MASPVSRRHLHHRGVECRRGHLRRHPLPLPPPHRPRFLRRHVRLLAPLPSSCGPSGGHGATHQPRRTVCLPRGGELHCSRQNSSPPDRGRTRGGASRAWRQRCRTSGCCGELVRGAAQRGHHRRGGRPPHPHHRGRHRRPHRPSRHHRTHRCGARLGRSARSAAGRAASGETSVDPGAAQCAPYVAQESSWTSRGCHGSHGAT